MKVAVILAVLLVGSWGISGCAVSRTKQALGKEYAVEHVVSIRPGMAEAEVIKLLSQPYARGVDLDGTPFLQYEYLVTTAVAFGAGVGVIGVTGSQSVSGGKARILLDPATRMVKAVQYETYGSKWYEKLRGGQRETPR